MSNRTENTGQISSGTAETVSKMTYPIAGPDGVYFDQIVTGDQLDELYDRCPTWCNSIKRGHKIEAISLRDRVHYGEEVGVIVRSIDGEWETKDDGPATVALGVARMYLQRRVQHREPTIWLGKNELGDGFEFLPAEAEQVARVLLRLAREGRAGERRGVEPACPTWCVVPLKEHKADASQWDGGWQHRSSEWPTPTGNLRLYSITGTEATIDGDTPRIYGLEDAQGALTADEARATAAALIELAALLDGERDA